MSFEPDEDEEEELEEQPEGYFTASGYAWYAYPSSVDAPDCPFASYVPNSGMRRDVEYYGPISTAKGLINQKREGGYLCITTSESAPDVLEGWEVEPAELDFDFEAHDMGTIRLVKERKPRDPDVELYSTYELEGWD
jgi:hypothetical protein